MNKIEESTRAFLVLLTAAVGLVIVGCEKKETIVDIETPGGSVQVERAPDTGNVDVLIEDKD